MKRWLTLIVLCTSVLLWSQEGLVLQRVYPAAPTVETNEPIPPLLLEAGETLFALINREQPLIRSGPEEANTVLETRLASATDGLEVRFSLIREGEEIADSAAVIPEENRYPAYRELLAATVERFVPLLDRVEPEVRVRELAADEETREVLNEVLFAEAMATPFEATLWAGLVAKNLSGEEGGPPLYLQAPFHYLAELAWFPAPNHGFSATFLFEYSSISSFGRDAADNNGAESDNLYLLPGIGYTYRTLGRLSAGFYTGLNYGWVRITAKEDLYDEGSLVLNSGDTESAFTHYMIMKPFVAYSLNETWSLKTSFSLYLSIFDMFNVPFSTGIAQGRGGGYLQFLNIGVGYRW